MTRLRSGRRSYLAAEPLVLFCFGFLGVLAFLSTAVTSHSVASAR